MSAALYVLTGIGSPWAQDPPHYAEVIAFEAGDDLDWAHTRLSDWRGWQHDRWVYFYHGGDYDGGPIVVVDEAEGPPGDRAALVWHLVGGGDREGYRLQLRSDALAEVLLLPMDDRGRLEVTGDEGGDSDSPVVYYTSADGRLRVVTLFLLNQWTGAEAVFDTEEQTLEITNGQAHIVLSLQSGN